MRTNTFLAGVAAVAIPAVALAQAAPGYLSQRDGMINFEKKKPAP